MSGIIGEVEFEFHEGDEGGEFLACGKVVNGILTTLARDEVDKAASLFASCAENVGDELMKEATGVGSSNKTITNLAQMFFKARDFARAAQCAELAGQPEMAAKFFEANYENDKAAAYYAKAGDHLKAAELLERNLNFDKAAELYVRARDFPRAAENFERAGKYYMAGQVYVKITRFDKALEVLQKVDSTSPGWVAATTLLGSILEKTGNHEMAMHRYLEVVKTKPIDEDSVEIHFRLGTLLAEKGYHPQAEKLLGNVLKVAPAHEGARQTFAKLPGRATEMPAAPQSPAGAAEPAAAPDTAPKPLDLGVGVESKTDDDRLVGVDHDFEFLRQVDLFRELSLDELKYVQSMCDRAQFQPDTKIIEQGCAGEAMFVIARGSAAVVARGPDGLQQTLAELGPGAYVGEMALLDDALTSASVVAVEPVNAYKLPRQRFGELMQANERIQLRIYRVLITTLLARLREANAKLAARAAQDGSLECPSCGEKLEETSAHCPHCGKAIEDR